MKEEAWRTYEYWWKAKNHTLLGPVFLNVLFNRNFKSWRKQLNATRLVARESRNMGAQIWVKKKMGFAHVFFLFFNAHVSLFYFMGAAPMDRPCFFFILTPMIFYFFFTGCSIFFICIFWVPSAHCPVPRARHDRILTTTAGRWPEFSTSDKWQRHTSFAPSPGPSSARCLHVAQTSLPLD